MRWKKLILEYFKTHNEGNTEDIKEWIFNKYLDKALEEVDDWIFKYNLGRLYTEGYLYSGKARFSKREAAIRKIRNTQVITYCLKNLFDEGILKRKENIRGICKYIYYKI